MPTYTYECREHKPPLQTFIIRSVEEAEKPVICPQCDKPKVRLFVAPPTWFKGSGWAKNDS